MLETRTLNFWILFIIYILLVWDCLLYINTTFSCRDEYNSTRHSPQPSLTLCKNKLCLPNTNCNAQGGYQNNFHPDVGCLLLLKYSWGILIGLKTYEPPKNSVYHDVRYVDEIVNKDGKELSRIQVFVSKLKYVKGHRTNPSMSVRKAIGTAIDYPNHRYDAGHIIPAIIGGSNKDASNFFPQHPAFNRGEWKKREAYIHKYLKEHPDAKVYQIILFEYVEGTYAPIGFFVSTTLEKPDPEFNIQIGYYENPDPFDGNYECPACLPSASSILRDNKIAPNNLIDPYIHDYNFMDHTLIQFLLV